MPGHNTRPHARFHGYGCMDDLTTELSFDSQGTWVIGVHSLYLDMLTTGVCTTRHWQTSGRLLQKLNICTVYHLCLIAWQTTPKNESTYDFFRKKSDI